MNSKVHQCLDIRTASGQRPILRRMLMVPALLVVAYALSMAPAHARGGNGSSGGGSGGVSGGIAGGAVMGAPQGGAMSSGGMSGVAPGPTYRHEYQHQERHRYGDGSAGLVQGRPDCGLGGPCQTGMPVERPKLDYGHRK